ncbi:MAG: hypothetical protein LBO62_02065 [Endomicrobium sp.]|jgi:predicted ATPase|nr:hypothetical protein [Endomicrobium sp.]
MKESIAIHNLGPIKDISIEEIKPFTVLVGESGSGKSVLMKVIALFRYLYKKYNVGFYLKHSNISQQSSFEFYMDEYLKNCGFEQFIKNDTKITYRVSNNGRTYTIEFNNSKLENIEPVLKDDLSFTKISFISEARNILPLYLENNSKENLGFYFNEVCQDFKLAEKIGDIALDFLNIEFKISKTQSEKKYLISSKEQGDSFEIDYKNSSSGIQNAVPIMLIAQYFANEFDFKEAFNRSALSLLSETDKLTDFRAVKNLGDLDKKIYIHIEEPELGLFPDAQCELINALVGKCFSGNKNKTELCLSTHSPYIINHLNLLIKAYEKNSVGLKYNCDDLAVYYIQDGQKFDLKVKNENLINTNILSETINNIYNEYEKLG